jgi:hypothetical protein
MDWMSIVGYEGLYEITYDKQFRNARTQRTIPVKSGNVVCFSKDGIPKVEKIRNLIGTAVIKPKEYLNIKAKSNKPTITMKSYPWWVDTSSTTSFIGDAGETMVCSELLLRGIKATYNPMAGSPYDIIGDFAGGNLFKIQVKSVSGATASTGQRRRSAVYKFSMNGKSYLSCDIFAYVAIDSKKIVFELGTNKPPTQTFNTDVFDRLSKTSIDNILHKLYTKDVTDNENQLSF